MDLSKLINRGLITVYGPLASFVVVCGLIANWYTSTIMKLEDANVFVGLIVFISVCIGWVWWSYKIVKWKYWAFSNVTVAESYELYSKAIESGLIWPTGSIFNKTEIWTKEDKQKWMTIYPEIQDIFKPEKAN